MTTDQTAAGRSPALSLLKRALTFGARQNYSICRFIPFRACPPHPVRPFFATAAFTAGLIIEPIHRGLPSRLNGAKKTRTVHFFFTGEGRGVPLRFVRKAVYINREKIVKKIFVKNLVRAIVRVSLDDRSVFERSNRYSAVTK